MSLDHCQLEPEEEVKGLGMWWPRDLHVMKFILAKADAAACRQE